MARGLGSHTLFFFNTKSVRSRGLAVRPRWLARRAARGLLAASLAPPARCPSLLAWRRRQCLAVCIGGAGGTHRVVFFLQPLYAAQPGRGWRVQGRQPGWVAAPVSDHITASYTPMLSVFVASIDVPAAMIDAGEGPYASRVSLPAIYLSPGTPREGLLLSVTRDRDLY